MDELSDARSLAASIRGETLQSFSEAPILNDDIQYLEMPSFLSRSIKGGGGESDETDHQPMGEDSVADYITDLFQPIFLDENIGILGEEKELAEGIKGGDEEPGPYQQHTQRAFLESAMEQNIKIQQQLIAQNEALQTLLCQQSDTIITSSFHTATSPELRQSKSGFKYSNDNHENSNNPPIPVRRF